MPNYVKLKPEVDLNKRGRIIIRDNRFCRWKLDRFLPVKPVNMFKLGGKSGKYLKSTVIPYYIGVIKNKNHHIRLLKGKIVSLQSRANAFINQIKKDDKSALRRLMAKNNREFKIRVTNEAIRRAQYYVRNIRRRSSKQFDGALALPSMIEYAYINKITIKQLSLLFLLGMMGECTPLDFDKWGYTSHLQSVRDLNRLEDMGLAICFGEKKNNLFAITLKGKAVIRSFQLFYHKNVTEKLSSNDFKERAFLFRPGQI